MAGPDASASGPTLAPPFNPVSSSSSTTAPATPDEKKKHKKRSLFGFGRKKTDETPATPPATASAAAATSTPGTAKSTGATPTAAASSKLPAPAAPPKDTRTARKPASPILVDSNTGMSGSITSAGTGGGYYVLPASPVRSFTALSSSPRVSSPANSQIFERDVQETSSILVPNSPAIPSHISTENHIPSVLDASSEAITDGHLDPDSVEIITHAHHQPAMLAVAGMNNTGGNSVGSASASLRGTSTNAWVDDVASSFADKDDSASNYGSFDNTDVRRLSFISFADVVQAEHQQQSSGGLSSSVGGGSIGGPNDSMHLAGLTSLAALGAMNRSPSPMRSPTATTTTGGFGTSPPTSKSGSIKGLEMSPNRGKTLGSTSPAMGSPTMSAVGTTGGGPASSSGSTLMVGGELSVETMSQALRRTGSGDLGGVRSMPQSPIEGPAR